MKKSEIFLPKVAAKPDNMLFRFSLGQALYDEGTTEAAIPHLQSCTDSRDDWMLPRILLGKSLTPARPGRPCQANLRARLTTRSLSTPRRTRRRTPQYFGRPVTNRDDRTATRESLIVLVCADTIAMHTHRLIVVSPDPADTGSVQIMSVGSTTLRVSLLSANLTRHLRCLLARQTSRTGRRFTCFRSNLTLP